eukprot:TRINITY_DN12484_c0_g1_i5.p1 TRINITY_DN12484_c0_g1~~TRINITY_DN12484_c0_g1_i5.p1  ORF type:complete len:228 (-),score=42.48 TRINITY_DN12484_c0_g1_i5:75-758(-)
MWSVGPQGVHWSSGGHHGSQTVAWSSFESGSPSPVFAGSSGSFTLGTSLFIDMRSDYKALRLVLGIGFGLGVLLLATHLCKAYQAGCRWTPLLLPNSARIWRGLFHPAGEVVLYIVELGMMALVGTACALVCFREASSLEVGVVGVRLVQSYPGTCRVEGVHQSEAVLLMVLLVVSGLVGLLASTIGVGPVRGPVSYTHLRAHETPEHLVCRLLLEKKKNKVIKKIV